MKVSRIVLSDFKFFRGRHVLDFPEGIIGVTGDDNVIYDGFLWCLYGKDSLKKGESVYFPEKREVIVEVTFKREGKEDLIVKRFKDKATDAERAFVTHNDEENRAISQENLKNLLCLTYREFMCSFYSDRFTPFTFLHGNGFFKYRLLSTIFDLDTWRRIKRIVRDYVMKVDHKISNIKSVLVDIPATDDTTPEEKKLRMFNNSGVLAKIRKSIEAKISKVEYHRRMIEKCTKSKKLSMKMRDIRLKEQHKEIEGCIKAVNDFEAEKERIGIENEVLRAQLKIDKVDTHYRNTLTKELKFLKKQKTLHSFVLGLFESDYIGIRSEKLCRELNNRIGYLLKRMGFEVGCMVEVDIEEERAFFRMLNRQGENIPLILRSDEEKLSLVLSFQVAFASLAKSSLKAGWSMFMFGSVFDTLHDKRIFDRVSLLLKNDFNFLQIFVRTNNDTIKNKVDHLLVIGRDIDGSAYSYWR